MSQTPQPLPEPSDQGPEDARRREDPQALRISRDRWRRIAVCLLVLGALVPAGRFVAVSAWPREELYIPDRQVANNSGHHLLKSFSNTCPETRSIDVLSGIEDPLYCMILGGLPGVSVEFTIRGKYMRVACAAEEAPHKTRCTTPTTNLGTFEP